MHWALGVLAAAVAVSSCGGIAVIDPTATGGTGGTTGTTTTTTTSGGGGHGGTPTGTGGEAGSAPECPELSLGSPDVVWDAYSTVDGTSEQTVACSTFDLREATFAYTAPASGLYAFKAMGPGLDMAIEIREADCEGATLACDQYSGYYGAIAVAPLDAGQTVAIIAETDPPAPFTLYLLAAPPCPQTQLGSTVPQNVDAVVDNDMDYYTLSCGPGYGSPDTTFGFTAPAAATYAVRATGAGPTKVVEVRDGGCAGPPLACDVLEAPADAVTDALAASQTVAVIVEAGMGPLELHVDFAQ